MPLISTRASVAYGAGFGKVLSSAGFTPSSSYDALASYVVPSGSPTSISFAGLPTSGQYTHLQIRFTTNGVPSNTGGFSVRFNADTGSSYNGHYLWTYGSSVSAGASTGTFGEYTQMITYYDQGIADSYPVAGVIDVLDYNSTNKNKVIRSLVGRDSNGSGQLWFSSGLWLNTSAVNTIALTSGSGGFAQHTVISLYGVRG